MGIAKLQRVDRFCLGSHLWLLKQGPLLRLTRQTRVCELCHTCALGNVRQLLLECPALGCVGTQLSHYVANCSWVMAKLIWFKVRLLVRKGIAACCDTVSYQVACQVLIHRSYPIHSVLSAAKDEQVFSSCPRMPSRLCRGYALK